MLIWILNTKKKFSKLGEENQTLYSDVLKETQQGFGNFKEIIIYKLRDNFSFQFKEILVKFCKNIRVLGVLTQIPRILLEQLAVILIIVMAITIFLFEEDKIKSAAIIGVYAYALFKILPSISKLILNLQKFFFESFKGLVALYLIYITIIVISSLFFGILFSNKFQFFRLAVFLNH